MEPWYLIVAGRYHEQIFIKEDSIGFSYDSVIARFLVEKCERVEIDDPYIRNHHQVCTVTLQIHRTGTCVCFVTCEYTC